MGEWLWCLWYLWWHRNPQNPRHTVNAIMHITTYSDSRGPCAATICHRILRLYSFVTIYDCQHLLSPGTASCSQKYFRRHFPCSNHNRLTSLRTNCTPGTMLSRTLFVLRWHAAVFQHRKIFTERKEKKKLSKRWNDVLILCCHRTNIGCKVYEENWVCACVFASATMDWILLLHQISVIFDWIPNDYIDILFPMRIKFTEWRLAQRRKWEKWTGERSEAERWMQWNGIININR